MNRSLYLFALVASVTVLACGGAGPSQTQCTECLDVAGHYSETMTSAPLGNPVSCSGGTTLRWQSWQTAFDLKQEGSALMIVDYNGQGDDLKGVLHDDLSVSFEPIRGIAHGENGAEDAPGKLSFVGQFREGSPPTFAGTHTFVKDADHCTIKAGVSWTRAK